MKKIFWVFLVFAAGIVIQPAKTAAFAESNAQLTAESNIQLSAVEFLTRLSNVLFRVKDGFTNSQLFNTKHGYDGILVSYNSSVFLTIQETSPPREIKNVSVVLITQEEDKEDVDQKGRAVPADNIVFENICKQVMYALHPHIKESDIKSIMVVLGFGGEMLDGFQRSACFGYCKYIIKYNSNGMLIMVVSGL